jgi:transcriptional regulator with XRE-family HTH domain
MLSDVVARNVRRIRMERGLSQEELADLVGISRNYVGMIERRENSPTVVMIERLAKALKVDPVQFFEEKKAR